MPADHSSPSTAREAELVHNAEGRLIKIPPARIGLSTSSVYPESTSSAFELARDGISQVFAHLGRDVRRNFDATEAALKRAVYVDPPG